jgi:hypothetical protein
LREVFPSTLILFSQGKKILNAPASFKDGFLMRGTFVSLTQLNRKFEANGTYVLLETPKLQEVIVSKTNSILT